MDPQDVAIDLSMLENYLPMLRQVLLIAAVLVGVSLWLLGRRVVRPACAMCGLVLGGLAASAMAQELGQGSYMLFALIGGAIVFGLLAWLLFRLWMGLSCAVLLAGVFLIAALASLGTSMPASNLTLEKLPHPLDAEATTELRQNFIQIYEQQKSEATGWWQRLGGTARVTIAICALAGGVAGLIIGLLFPNLAASFQSALVGALLMVYSGLQLLTVHAPDMAAKVAMTTRLHLILLGLITIMGVAIQWTLFQRKADR